MKRNTPFCVCCPPERGCLGRAPSKQYKRYIADIFRKKARKTA